MSAILKELVSKTYYDAVVVGSGPNGLACAIVLAQAGLSVLVVEAQSTAGGGCRSLELTLPGFVHDICSSIHPLGIGSPYFRTLNLERYGLDWVQPDAPFGHPLTSGDCAILERSVDQTAENLGVDGAAYRRLMGGLLPDWDYVAPLLLEPWKLAQHPYQLAHFGMKALMSARTLATRRFQTNKAQTLFAGIAAHSGLRMDEPASAAFAFVLGLAGHAVGWPFPRGGAQSLINALVELFKSYGGEIILGCPVSDLDELPSSRLQMCDITPSQLLNIAGKRLPRQFKNQIGKYKYGPASFKIDWALNAPVPWQNEQMKRAGTAHLGASLEEIADSEALVAAGLPPEKPYVLLAQTSLFDATRAPVNQHTLWGYCHIPNGSDFDMTERIEDQIERFAPGFRKTILKRNVLTPKTMEEKNANHVGGDINGGALSLGQLFSRPLIRKVPYSTPVPGLYLCSSSTPPGGGVHGMSGYYAAKCALNNWR